MNQVAFSSVEEKVTPIKLFEALCEWTLGAECMGMRMHDVESRGVAEGREVLRSVLQQTIDARGLGDVGPRIQVVTDVADENGEPPAVVTFTNRRVRDREIRSTLGPIDIERTVYYRAVEQSVVPLDEQLQVPLRSFSYVMQQKIATSVARGPFAEAAKVVVEATGGRKGGDGQCGRGGSSRGIRLRWVLRGEDRRERVGGADSGDCVRWEGSADSRFEGCATKVGPEG